MAEATAEIKALVRNGLIMAGLSGSTNDYMRPITPFSEIMGI